MMRSLITLTAVLVLLGAPQAYANQRNGQPAGISLMSPVQPVPQIVLYTMGQGEVIFEKFGHAALCVEYPQAPRYSRCYNYGTTDFSDPVGLFWGFLRGEARFWSSVTTPGSMLRFYRSLDRTIWRQVLPLDDAQALVAAEKLDFDSQEENRYYKYHHFYDNCTTRVRDIVDQVMGGVLKKDSDRLMDLSFREYGGRGFAEQTYLLITADFILGRRGDLKPTLWQAMFLPDILREEVHKRMGLAPELLYERQGRQFSQDPGTYGREWLVLFALLLAAPLAISRLTGRAPRAAAAFAAVPLFVMALVVWGMAIVTSLPELRFNEVLLVFWPTDIMLPFLSPARRMRYAQVRVASVVVVSLLMAVGVLVQPMWAVVMLVFVPHIVLAIPRRVSEPAGSTVAAEAA